MMAQSFLELSHLPVNQRFGVCHASVGVNLEVKIGIVDIMYGNLVIAVLLKNRQELCSAAMDVPKAEVAEAWVVRADRITCIYQLGHELEAIECCISSGQGRIQVASPDGIIL